MDDRTSKKLDRFDTLTPREREVLQLVVKGLTSAQIAARLSISPSTATGHLSGIYRKLDVRGQADLIALTLSRGSITKED